MNSHIERIKQFMQPFHHSYLICWKENGHLLSILCVPGTVEDNLTCVINLAFRTNWELDCLTIKEQSQEAGPRQPLISDSAKNEAPCKEIIGDESGSQENDTLHFVQTDKSEEPHLTADILFSIN